MSISPRYVDGIELRVRELNEQVENARQVEAEAAMKLGESLIKIGTLEEQVEKLTAQLAESEQARAYEIGIKCKFSSDLTDCEKQVERLTKERDALLAEDSTIHRLKDETIVALGDELATLAEQNEKMREILKRIHNTKEPWSMWDIEQALSLPNFATPVLNRIKAEAYREAGEIAGPEDSYKDQWFKAKADSCAKLRAKADELENGK